MSSPTFEVLILGSSSATPAGERNQTAQLINVSERYLLIDCGEATQIQLRKFKAKFQRIDHIFISHLHGDHFFGLPGLLGSMHLLGRTNPLTIYGPPELPNLINAIHKASDSYLNYEINWVTTKNDKEYLLFEDDKIEVYSFPLQHRIFCTGFLIKEKPYLRKIDKFLMDKNNISIAEINNLRAGKDVKNENGETINNSEVTIDPLKHRSYAYCSDTLYNEEIVKHIQSVDALYHESTFLEDKKDRAKQTYHSTAKQAAQIAKLANVGKLLLGHYSARYGNLELFKEEASTVFLNTELTKEGTVISIPHGEW
ncbi:MAG: ribonuclease Z [Bacteroidia bacterium]